MALLYHNRSLYHPPPPQQWHNKGRMLHSTQKISYNTSLWHSLTSYPFLGHCCEVHGLAIPQPPCLYCPSNNGTRVRGCMEDQSSNSNHIKGQIQSPERIYIIIRTNEFLHILEIIYVHTKVLCFSKICPTCRTKG